MSKYANLVSSFLVEQIEDYVAQQSLQEGDRLPSEREFCTILGVSRMTLRQAVKKLCEEKKLINVQNRGYFIAPSRIRRNFTAKEEQPYDSYRLIGIERIHAQGSVAVRLRLMPNSEVYKIKRICICHGERISIETSYFPVAEMKSVDIQQLDEDAIWEFYRLEDCGEKKHKDIHISLGKASFEESEWLGIPEGSVVAVERHMICADEMPVGMTEYVSSIGRIGYSALLLADRQEEAGENC